MSEVLLTMMGPERAERMERVLDARLIGLTVLLEDVHKPANMAACIRTVEALGLQTVHIIEDSAEWEPNPRITKGCDKWVDVQPHRDAVSAAKALKAQGFRILATSLEATKTLPELDLGDRVALCFGNELHGMTPELQGLADETFKIPMFGYSASFNLSVSVGICVQVAAAARRAAVGKNSDLSAEERAELRRRWIPLLRKGSDQILEAMARRPADQ
ncbi:MAG: tRNA (guanosine-2'-O-)-methyltransferase [Myxococcota bacterium]|jgi:tRNA (guanosine-2'-O-)-methyltransferase